MSASFPIWRVGSLVAVLTLISGCGPKSPPAGPLDGRTLAASACVRCHSLPSPSQLSPEEWPYLLAWMGVYLGHLPDVAINDQIVVRQLVPQLEVVTREQLDAIKKYYLDEAKVQYHDPPAPSNPPVSTLFEPVPVPIPAPVISMAAIDPSNHALVIGSSRPPGLSISLQGVITTNEVVSEPVSLERLGSIQRIALIGHLGHDARVGQVVDFDTRDGTRKLLVDRQPRITAHRTADLDRDGRDDLFVCGFGDNNIGRVGIWWGAADTFKEEILFVESGAVWGDVADLDGDGDLDLVLAIANARPRIVAFVNEGPRRFQPRTIMERPVGWGYNRCLLVDWDGDGDLDFVETAGNNLELRGRPLKAHHGVRVLRNDGNLRFVEILFEPLAGAIDVVAADFDRNGRMDLAVTGFYSDWRQPVPTTFLLLLQRTDGTVERAGIDNRYWNRWMRIGAGDADGDGDIDLLLGAAEVPMGIPSEYERRCLELLQDKASVLLLRNRTVP